MRVAARVTSLRRLDWDSMRVNFFVIASPGLLDSYPASFITSFRLPPQSAATVNALVREFPNVTVIDVEALLRQMNAIFDQVARAVAAVFGFALLAGVAVLVAALQSGQDERAADLALMRALGARRAQVRAAVLAEFAVLGGIAGLLGGLRRRRDCVGAGALRLPSRLPAGAGAAAARRRARPGGHGDRRTAGHAAPHAAAAVRGAARRMS